MAHVLIGAVRHTITDAGLFEQNPAGISKPGMKPDISPDISKDISKDTPGAY
jgi:hypothetical protein